MKNPFAVLTATVVAVLGAGLSVTAPAAEGEIVAEREYFAVKGPWLVWKQDQCAFVETDEHPETYRGVLRKSGPEGLSLVYTTAETSLVVSKTINGSFEKYAELAGIDMKMFSNQFPSKTKPIEVAQQAAALRPAVVISSVWIPDLYPRIGKTYERECVPFLNMFDFRIPFTVPGFQAGFVASGLALADGIIQVVRERGWAAEDTWMVICGAPQNRQQAGHGPRRHHDLRGQGGLHAGDPGSPDQPGPRLRGDARPGADRHDGLAHGASAGEERDRDELERHRHRGNDPIPGAEGLHPRERGIGRRGRPTIRRSP